jgi:hypothetical protein
MTSSPPVLRFVWGMVLAATLGTAPTAVAQTPPAPAEGAELRPAEIQRLFDAYLVMEAQQTLGLTDQQYGPFLTKLKLLQETRRKYLASRAMILLDLGRMTGPRAPKTDDAAIRERLASLQELESRSAAEARRAYADLDALLDPRQQARFRVFEDQIERRKIELMLRARQNARQQRQPRR